MPHALYDCLHRYGILTTVSLTIFDIASHIFINLSLLSTVVC